MLNKDQKKVYEEPKLIDLLTNNSAQGDCVAGPGVVSCGLGSGATSTCSEGASAVGSCSGGAGGGLGTCSIGSGIPV